MKSLLTRLLIIVAAAVLPAVAFQTYSALDAGQVRARLIEDAALRLLHLSVALHQRIIGGTEQMLTTVSVSPALQDPGLGLCHRLLAGIVEHSPQYLGVALFGLDGRVTCTSNPSIPDIDVSGRDYFRHALQKGGLAVGGYVVGLPSRLPTIHVAQPFKGPDGKVAGVVAAALSLDWVNQQLAQLPLPPWANSVLADRNGVFVARRPNAERYVGQQLRGELRFILEGQETQVVQTSSLEGGNVMLAYSPPGTDLDGLLVGVGVNRNLAFASVTRADQLGLLMIMTAVVLALAVTALLGGRLIRRPVHRLLLAAERWRTGDFAARTGIAQDSGEFGRLAGAFDAMASEQQARGLALDQAEARRAEAEAARARRDEEFIEAQCAAHIGSWYWDAASDVLTGSEEFFRIYGLDPASKELRPLGEQRPRMYPAGSVERIKGAARQALETGAGYELDIEARRDGELIWVMTRGEVMRSPEGNIVGLRGTVQDITHRKRAEEALRQLNETLENRISEEVAAREAAQSRAAQSERLAALGQLAGGIAHDFNNVLQGIFGAAALIERRAGDEAAARRLARIALQSAERGASITRRLLAFGHRSNLQAEEVDAAALLDNFRAVLVRTLGAGIDVQVATGDSCPVLLADRGQLETALLNLAANARDAMPGGGSLILSLGTDVVAEGEIHRVGLAGGNYVRISVADTGTGMDEGTLKRATEPFFTTKGVGVGTGLGLSVVNGFVGQSGGGMAIDSTPGKGTTVTLWMPRAVAAEGQACVPAPPNRGDGTPGDAASASVAKRGERVTVLVVDDEDVIREMIAEQLEAKGFRALTARNGSEALTLLDEDRGVGVLLTDLSMPGMDGLAVIRAAQARRPGLPAVLLTGYAENDTALAIDGAIRQSFSLLRKPIKADQLIDCIRSLSAARIQAGN